jgi:thiamine-monophosphate kinase
MPSEFALIDRYFRHPPRDPGHTVLGVGDDGAIVRATAGCELVVSTDMLVAGTHFLVDTDPEDLGWKTLAVNVSDMAAMGAQPRWALLAAALPAATEAWIEKFARGFFACANTFDIDVIGGDTTRGPLNFCVTIFGEVPAGTALLRSGAQTGDEIWVSGAPGRAALGLAHLQGRTHLEEPVLADCLAALHRHKTQLYKVVQSNSSSSVDVFPALRKSYAGGTSIIYGKPNDAARAQGVFRLASPSTEWSIGEASIYGVGFAIIEDVET